jgi:hypothetical protein
VDAGLLRVSGARFSISIKEMAVILDDAPLLDHRQFVCVSFVLGFVAPGTRWKPDRFGVLANRLSHVSDSRVRPTEDHNEIHLAAEIGEMCVRWQISDRRSIQPYRNHVVPSVVEIPDHFAAVSRSPWTRTDHGDRPGPFQEPCDKRFRPIHVLHGVRSTIDVISFHTRPRRGVAATETRCRHDRRGIHGCVLAPFLALDHAKMISHEARWPHPLAGPLSTGGAR